MGTITKGKRGVDWSKVDNYYEIQLDKNIDKKYHFRTIDNDEKWVIDFSEYSKDEIFDECYDSNFDTITIEEAYNRKDWDFIAEILFNARLKKEYEQNI